MRWVGESVTVRRAALTTDAYGNAVPDWDAAAEVVLRGVGVAPRSTEEDLVGRTAVITGTALYVPGERVVDVRPEDQVIVRGVAHAVDGDVQDWISPFTGRRAGWVIPLRRVTG